MIGIFNILIIAAISIIAIPNNESRRISNMSLFLTTSFFSLLSYVWLLIILTVTSPEKIEVWEAGATLGLFPVFCVASFCAEKNWLGKCFKSKESEKDQLFTDISSKAEYFKGLQSIFNFRLIL